MQLRAEKEQERRDQEQLAFDESASLRTHLQTGKNESRQQLKENHKTHVESLQQAHQEELAAKQFVLVVMSRLLAEETKRRKRALPTK